MRRDAGAASVEFALVVPAIVVLLAAVLGVGQWSARQATAQTAAATGARIAIVDDDAAAIAAAERISGESIRVAVERDGPWVTVVVRDHLAWGLPVEARAVARGSG